MKKKVLTMVVVCSMTMGARAQIGPYDSAVQMPSMDLYDDGAMNAYIGALAATAERRSQQFNYYYKLAVDAYCEDRWYDAIRNVNSALSTQYTDGMLYYIRGYAYEQLGNWKEAKKDYKTGKKYGDKYSIEALENLQKKEKAIREMK